MDFFHTEFFFTSAPIILFGTIPPWRMHQCARLESATHQQNSTHPGHYYMGVNLQIWREIEVTTVFRDRAVHVREKSIF